MRALVPVFVNVALTLFPVISHAATLTGHVRTAFGAGVPHVVLVVKGAGLARTTVTGAAGRFRVETLPAGEYVLEVATPGFVLSPEPRVTLGEGEAEARLDVTLGPAPVREHVVVSATRSEAAISTLGVTATVIDAEQLAARGASTVLHVLQDVPGVTVARTGGVGSQASAFVRGGESRFARILVDGVPVNEPGGAQDFGHQLPLELAQVEIVRGAASSLYGTDALAGVIQLVTRRAAPGEGFALHGEVEAGSFAWRRLHGGTSGRQGRFDWNAGVVRLETDNHQPNSAFDESAAAASLGLQIGETSALRVVLRGDSSDVGTPGQTAFGPPDLEEGHERRGLVLGGQLRHLRARVAHELRWGLSMTDQLSRDPVDSGSFVPEFEGRRASFESFDFVSVDGFQNDTRRMTLGYQAEVPLGERHLVTAGAELERETGEVGSRPDDLISPHRTNTGAYLQDRIVLGDRLFATVGARVERNHNFGTRAVPRGAIAWRLRGGTDATTLRASAGEGIKEPSFFESFGVSDFARGNPDLLPERSRTFDVGLEQRALRGRLRAEATLFHHEYRDQIAFTVVSFSPFRGTYENLGKTRGRGAEVSLEAAPTRYTAVSAHYTYLDGEILESSSTSGLNAPGQGLLRRPKHQASVTARAGNERVTVGATLVRVGARPDSDFAGLDLTENEGYVRLDARARVRLLRGLEAFVAGENLLDREYQEALGYPALGRAVRAGLRYHSGR